MRHGNQHRNAWIPAFAILAGVFAGCSQSQHRLNADKEAYCTIAERNHDPRWASDVSIDLDPRSRYFDPYDPDCSPMPEDDPASHQYMHCVDGKKGWSHWGDNGVRSSLENPQWRARLVEYTELDDEGAVKLSVDSAIRLAYMHSPLHQQNLETLYLSSLDVTGERFRLDTQFFGGNALTYAHGGNANAASIAYDNSLGRYVVVDPSGAVESNRLTLRTNNRVGGNNLRATKQLATAGQVLVGFANSFAFEFTGNNVSLASSLANFSIIQPLLQGAGRDIALNQLTLTERRLLANLRAYSQFRQGFYTQVVIGELGVSGPQRNGTGTNLQSFSGFGGVNGYLGLLQQAQQIRNTEDNLRLQLRTRERLEALYDNDLIDIVQVDQFRQNIEVTRANLLDQTNSLELAVDNYKTQILGLPADLRVYVDEKLVEGFQLIPPDSNPILESLLKLQSRIGSIGELMSLATKVELLEARLPSLGEQDVDEAEGTLIKLQSLVEGVGRRIKFLSDDLAMLQNGDQTHRDALSTKSVQEIASQVGDDEAQFQRKFEDAVIRLKRILDKPSEEGLKEAVAEYSDWYAEMLSLCHTIVSIQSAAQNVDSEPDLVLKDIAPVIEPVRELFESARSDIERMDEIASDRESSMSDDETSRFKRDRERLHVRLNDLQNGGAGFESLVEQLEQIRDANTDGTRAKTVRSLTAWILSYIQLAERLSLIPAQARLEAIMVEEVDLDSEAAFELALNNRLDFMNGRAALVDSWRNIQVAADALQSNLTVTASGDVGTARDNPVDFRASTSNLRLGVEFDAPLARLLERNGYRESLINYQRSRRSLIQSHDSLQRGLRALLRTLKQRRLQLEIQRRAVSIALRRVDQTQLNLLTPSAQGAPGVRPQINPTTAINLLSAQSSLQNSQNSFLAAWLNYYAARLRLYRELGAMQLDPSGRWIENSIDFGSADQTEDQDVEPLPPPMPIDLNVEFFDEVTDSAGRSDTALRQFAEGSGGVVPPVQTP